VDKRTEELPKSQLGWFTTGRHVDYGIMRMCGCAGRTCEMWMLIQNRNPNANLNPDHNPKPDHKLNPTCNISQHFTCATSASTHAHFTIHNLFAPGP